MPMNRKLYPLDWGEIAHRKKTEAGWKCQECGAPHGELVCWDVSQTGRWLLVEGLDLESLAPNWKRPPVRVQLGVAHLDQNPGNNDSSNLKVLCRGCHLRYDAPYHSVKAQKTKHELKREAILAAGQLELFREENP